MSGQAHLDLALRETEKATSHDWALTLGVNTKITVPLRQGLVFSLLFVVLN